MIFGISRDWMDLHTLFFQMASKGAKIIEDELDEIRRCCESQIPSSKVVTDIPAML